MSTSYTCTMFFFMYIFIISTFSDRKEKNNVRFVFLSDFDEKTSDDWDVDMSAYYDPSKFLNIPCYKNTTKCNRVEM